MSQSLSRVFIHAIFSTKNRYPFLKNLEIRKRLYAYMQTICHHYKCEVISINGMEDHIHLLINLHKTISISTLLEEIKKSSSSWIKKLDIDNKSLSEFFWQKGYGVFSVSQSNFLSVKSYIEKQAEHHKKYNFQEELIKFLKQHGVDYNEQYLWD